LCVAGRTLWRSQRGLDMVNVGVVGLGTMGLGIAQVFLAAGHSVLATDSNAPTRQSAKGRLAQTLDKRVAAGKITTEKSHADVSRFAVFEGLVDLAPCDLVIEAIAEKLDAKRALFAELEPILSKKAILATNTSALSINEMSQVLVRPERLLGLHFFNPAPAMKLVELVVRSTNAPDAIRLARQIVEAAGKTVIECADQPGFIVNRCARPFYGEALAMLEEGQSAVDIDAAMLAAGYRLGPFALIDLIGADINLAATKSLYDGMQNHPRYYLFQSLIDQVASGKLGAKTGKGFVTGTQIAPQVNDAIVLRIEATLANEAASLLDDGAQSPASIDLAMKLALNFPRGPFESAQRWGLTAVRDALTALAINAPPPLKGRYDISPSLLSL
jgi:3-hydroxybutyryl-CoA dehydrogenase